MSDHRNLYADLGPPDPINYLRPVTLSSESDLQRLDSEDEGIPLEQIHPEHQPDDDEEPPHGLLPHASGRRPHPQRQRYTSEPQHQDPPARERPTDGQAWPYRETLSFTRSLVFYGAGFITTENEQACRYIQEARSFRQKYLGGNGITVASDEELQSPQIQLLLPEDGIAQLILPETPHQSLIQVPSVAEFHQDYSRLV